MNLRSVHHMAHIRCRMTVPVIDNITPMHIDCKCNRIVCNCCRSCARSNFSIEMLVAHDDDDDDDFLRCLVFTNEATFRLSGKVNNHNVRI
jgi:hypothetical protein